jgi:predicted transcriptional regulator
MAADYSAQSTGAQSRALEIQGSGGDVAIKELGGELDLLAERKVAAHVLC